MTDSAATPTSKTLPGYVGALWISAVTCWWVGTILPGALFILSQLIDSPIILLDRFVTDSGTLGMYSLYTGIPFWCASLALYVPHALIYDPPPDKNDVGDFRFLQPWAVRLVTPVVILGGVIAYFVSALDSYNYRIVGSQSSGGCRVVVSHKDAFNGDRYYVAYMSEPHSTNLQLIGRSESVALNTYRHEGLRRSVSWASGRPTLLIAEGNFEWHLRSPLTCDADGN